MSKKQKPTKETHKRLNKAIETMGDFYNALCALYESSPDRIPDENVFYPDNRSREFIAYEKCSERFVKIYNIYKKDCSYPFFQPYEYSWRVLWEGEIKRNTLLSKLQGIIERLRELRDNAEGKDTETPPLQADRLDEVGLSKQPAFKGENTSVSEYIKKYQDIVRTIFREITLATLQGKKPQLANLQKELDGTLECLDEQVFYYDDSSSEEFRFTLPRGEIINKASVLEKYIADLVPKWKKELEVERLPAPAFWKKCKYGKFTAPSDVLNVLKKEFNLQLRKYEEAHPEVFEVFTPQAGQGVGEDAETPEKKPSLERRLSILGTIASLLTFIIYVSSKILPMLDSSWINQIAISLIGIVFSAIGSLVALLVALFVRWIYNRFFR